MNTGFGAVPESVATILGAACCSGCNLPVVPGIIVGVAVGSGVELGSGVKVGTGVAVGSGVEIVSSRPPHATNMRATRTDIICNFIVRLIFFYRSCTYLFQREIASCYAHCKVPFGLFSTDAIFFQFGHVL